MKRFKPSILTSILPGLLVIFLLLILPQAAMAANPAGNLDQIRNGSASSPVDPGAWVNGNLNGTQAHYLEGQVVPYRLTLTNLAIGTTYYIQLEWDVKHSDKNALDFITGYLQTPPVGISEAVLPTTDVITGSYTTTTANIPTPTFLPTAPLASFTGSSSIFTAFNGTLGSTIGYFETPDYTQAQTTCGVTLQVTATNATAVLAWGGHIASRLDWGYTNGVPNSAGGISGSPYHMRFIGMGTDGTTFSGGNQDRSLSAAAVFFPPSCILLNSSESVCTGASVTFRDSVVLGTGTSFTSSWTKLPSTTVIATTQNLTLTNVTAADAGTYQVIITDNDGYKDTCTATLTVGTGPSLSIVTDTITCTHTIASVTVSATPSTGATYLWKPDPLSGQGTATATYSTSGSVKVIVTSQAGCADSISATIGIDTTKPSLSITCDSLSCVHTVATLSVTSTPSTGVTYLWKPDPASGQGTATATYTTPGTKWVIVTKTSNGCTDSISCTITQNNTLPSLSITCDSLNCIHTVASLTVSSTPSTGITILWKPAPASGQGTATATYTTPGTKWAIVTINASGCVDSISCTVTQDTTKPRLNLVPDTITCIHPQATVCNNVTYSNPATYVWSPAPVSGQGTSCAVYSDSGWKKLVVTFTATGCVDSAQVYVPANTTKPSLSISCDSLTCTHTTATLAVTATPSTGVSYVWKPAPASGQGTATATYTTPGIKWVIVTITATGCVDSISCNVTQDNTLPRLSISCDSLNCIHTVASLTVTSTPSTGVTYLWKPDPVSGQGTATATYTTPGTKWVLVTNNATGCTDSISCTVTQDTARPRVRLTANNIDCNHPQSTVCDTVTYSKAVTYAWSPAPVSGQGTSCAVYSDSGWKKVVVTFTASGCMDSAMIHVSANTTPPGLTVQTDTITCLHPQATVCVTATPSTGVTYVWSPEPVSGQGTSCAVYADSGWKKVVVTITATGCKDSINAYVPANTTLPSFVIASPSNIVCGATGLTISVANNAGWTYQWSVIQGDWAITGGATTYSATFNAGTTDSATFKIVVTITATGCKDSATVTLHCAPPPRLFCSLTQGAYGNANGMFMGMRRTQLINYLIAKTGSLTVGKTGRSLTFNNGTASCIISRLPAGGPAATLPATLGNYVVGTCPSGSVIPLNSTGRFKNVLLGQVITLSLNVRLDTLLGNFILCSQFTTQAHLTDTVFMVYHIPASVLTALNTLSLPNTVYGLLELANRALAGQNTAGASLTDINSAVDAINQAFDGCRYVSSTCGIIATKNVQQYQPEKLIPTAYAVSANYPNPFNPTTSIDYELPQASMVQLVIFNVLGQKVATLINGEVESGYHSVLWNATNNGGMTLPSGLYFYRFQATSVTTGEQFSRTVKMLLMK